MNKKPNKIWPSLTEEQRIKITTNKLLDGSGIEKFDFSKLQQKYNVIVSSLTQS